MPELPEMQALSERLDELLAGAPVASITSLGFAALKTVEPTPDSLIGQTLQKVGRTGKYLEFHFSGSVGARRRPRR